MTCKTCGGKGYIHSSCIGGVTGEDHGGRIPCPDCIEGEKFLAREQYKNDCRAYNHIVFRRKVWGKHRRGKKPELPKKPKNPDGGCFITTAILNSLGKDDDCWELNTMRRFRDNYLLPDSNLKELVHEYYQKSPFLLKKLNKIEQYKPHIYSELYTFFLCPIIENIKNDEFYLAINKYIEMVNYLEAL